jgi:hypothetical protein
MIDFPKSLGKLLVGISPLFRHSPPLTAAQGRWEPLARTALPSRAASQQSRDTALQARRGCDPNDLRSGVTVSRPCLDGIRK